MKLFGFWRSLATFRVRIALNLKSVPYEEVSIDLLKGNQFEDTYRKVNPQSVVPALDDGEGPALFESLAILEFLDERFPKPPLLPEGARARARVRGISQMVACDAHPLIVPRIRKYLATEYKLDDDGVNRWCQHWFNTMSASSCLYSVVRYFRMRGTISGCASQATIWERPRTRARARASSGSNGGFGKRSSRYSRIASDSNSAGPSPSSSAGTTLCGLTLR